MKDKLISRNSLVEFANNNTVGIDANDIMRFPTIPAITIPEGVTNGDMIKALFPCLEKYEYEEPYTHGIALVGNGNRVTWFANEWWNAPFKRSETK